MTLELTIKVTLILCAVALGGLMLRRASAAARHLVQVSGLAAAMLLPMLALTLPAWELPVLSPDKTEIVAGVSDDRGSDPSASNGFDLLPALDAARSPSVERRLEQGEDCECETAPVAIPESAEAPSLAATVGDPSGGPGGGSAAAWLIGLWVTGAVAVLGRLMLGWVRMTRLAIEAVPLECGNSWRLVDECRGRLGVRTVPRVLLSGDVEVPVLWGFIRPTLMLPRRATGWPARRLRIVLLHELAHLRRMDGLALLIGRLAAAVWWFHPLAWFVEGRARRDCERACDDVVLASGERPSNYARQLLDIASALPDSTPTPAGALAVTGPGPLEARLRSILHPGVRRGLGRRSAVVLLCLALVGLVSVSSAQLVARSADPQPTATDEPERLPATDRRQELRLAVREAAPSRDDGIMLAHDEDDDESREGAAAFKKAFEFHRSEQWEEAIRGFEEAAAAGYRPGTSLYNAACGHGRLGHTSAAIDLIERAIEEGFDSLDHLYEDSDLDPIRSDAAFRALLQDVGERHDMRGRADRMEVALERYEDLLDHGAEEARDWYEVGSALLSVRDFDRGIDALERASKELGHRNHNALYNLACAHSLHGDSRRALDYLKQAVLAGFDSEERFRNDSDLDNIRGEARFDDIEDLHDALSMDRFNRWDNGRSRYSARRWEPAVESYTALTRAHPDIGRAWHNLGFSLHYSRRHADARAAFEKQVELGYRVPTGLFNIACTHAMEGNSEQALEWLGRAVETGEVSVGQILGDEDLESLQGEPRFETILERADELDEDDDGRHKMKIIKRWKERKKSRVNLH